MNKKGIRQFSPEMRLRSRDRWRIKGASPSGTSRGPTFSPKFHLNVLNLGRNDMKQAIVRNHEAVQHPNPRFCTPEVEPVSHSNSRATSGGHSPIGQRVLRPRDCAGPQGWRRRREEEGDAGQRRRANRERRGAPLPVRAGCCPGRGGGELPARR